MHSQFKCYHVYLSFVHTDFQDTKGMLTHMLTYTKKEAAGDIPRSQLSS